MRVKRKLFLTGAIMILMISLFALIVLITKTPVTASAATTPKYTVHFSYNAYYKSNTTTTTTGLAADTTSARIRIGQSTYSTYSIELWGSGYSGTGDLPIGGAVNSSTVSVKLNSTSGSPTITIKDSSGTTVGSGKDTVTMSGLADDTYEGTFSDSGGWLVNNRQYDQAGFSASFSFKVDTVAPTISGASMSTTGKYTNSAFTVTASDSSSGIEAIYWRDSVSTTYSSVSGSSKTVSAGSTNGLYRFYAVDKAGNTSATYYVYYDNIAPVGKVTTDSGATVINGGITNESFSYSVTENGSGLKTLYYKTPSSTSWQTYTVGATISANAEQGVYTFWATDKAGNSETYTVNLADPCADGHDYIPKFILPTCTSGGYTLYTCSRCGVIYTADNTAALGHSYAAVVISPTCTSGGYTTYTCTRCNYSYTGNTTSAAGHSYAAKVTAPTCTSTGYTVYTCTKCGYSYTGNTTAALGHSYAATATSPSCTEEGYTTYKCTRCGISHTDSPTQATGHSYVASVTEPTCTERGYTIFTCTKCGDTYRDNETAPSGHNYVSEVISSACTEGGYTIYQCTKCGDSYNGGYTQPTGHNYVTRTIAATCSEGGYSLHTCSICGESYQDNITQPLGHNFISTTREATCTQFGGTVYTCQICGYEYGDNSGNYPKGHNYTTTIITAPTCTTEGLRRSVCDDCGDSYETVIAANGHNYVISDVVSENGITTRTYTCMACGKAYTQELGDQYEEVSNYVEYLFTEYSPYMWWVLLVAAGVWSIVIGVMIAIAHKNEDKEKARKMLINYVIGLVVIAVIVVACPYLIRGIAALIT